MKKLEVDKKDGKPTPAIACITITKCSPQALRRYRLLTYRQSPRSSPAPRRIKKNINAKVKVKPRSRSRMFLSCLPSKRLSLSKVDEVCSQVGHL